MQMSKFSAITSLLASFALLSRADGNIQPKFDMLDLMDDQGNISKLLIAEDDPNPTLLTPHLRATNCVNTNNGSTDLYGDGCEWYATSYGNNYCFVGWWDTDNFSAETMCCTCGGGTTSTGTADSGATTTTTSEDGVVTECTDSNNGAVDAYNNDCVAYTVNTSWCQESFNTLDFNA